MTNPIRTTAHRAPMDRTRKTALVAGLLYLITFISIPTLALYAPAKTDPTFIIGAGATTPILVGGFLEMIVALAGIGTAVALFSVLKRQHEGFALGFVTTRIFEAGVIAIGVMSILSVVTLQQPGATGAEATSLVTVGGALVSTYNWTFLLGQSLMPGLNALMLGTVLYRSGLVPRAIPALGLIGAPILITAVVATLFGAIEQYSPVGSLAAVPIAIWELSLGLWLTFKGFRPAAVAALAASSTQTSQPVVAAAPAAIATPAAVG
jgi:hypothetical protein